MRTKTVKVHNVEPGSEAWRALRAGLYTGSNAHKILKFGAIKYSEAANESWGGNYFTKRGHILEQEAIELYEQIKSVEVPRPGFVTNSKYPKCGYSPDGLLPVRTLEVKSFNPERHKANSTGEIELEILAQCHFGMLICAVRLCDLLLYNPELPPQEALVIRTIRQKPAIVNNFKNILGVKA